jgi:DUF1009 family protein
MTRLAVLAGGGALPGQIARAAEATGFEVYVLAFEGESDPDVTAGRTHAWVGLGSVGRALGQLKAWQIDEVCLIGRVRRPNLSALKLDWRGARLLSRLAVDSQGDDRVLRTIVGELEREGFRVRGADELLEGLLVPAGVLTRAAPGAEAQAEIGHGIQLARRLGELDVGQAVVVQRGLVLGVEAIEGTDALLERCAGLRRDGPGGVLVKLKKPRQERRADLPTIGPATVDRASKAGLGGIAVEAGQCLLVDRDEAVTAADRAGLFIVGLEPAG